MRTLVSGAAKIPPVYLYRGIVYYSDFSDQVFIFFKEIFTPIRNFDCDSNSRVYIIIIIPVYAVRRPIVLSFFFDKIIDVVTLLGGDVNDAL